MSGDDPYNSWEDAVRRLREQPEHQKIVVDCYYDDPLMEAANRYYSSEEWLAIQKISSAFSGAALDVGAGRGIASYALAMDGFEVTSLEPNPSELVGAAAIRSLSLEAGLNIKVVENFSEKLPFADGVFDLIFARAVLHHTLDLRAACVEFHRVLKPGGIFLAIREHVVSNKADIPIFLDQHPLHYLYGGENAFLLDQYREAIEGAGFVKFQLISPWASAINYAPRTLKELKFDLLVQIDKFIPWGGKIFKLLILIPGAWAVICFTLRYIDNRPGRLYSFVARKS